MSSSLFDGGGALPAGEVRAALFFLVLLCFGLAVDIGLAIYALKRPLSPASWAHEMVERARSGRTVLVTFLALVALYLVNSAIYTLFFPDVTVAEPHTLIFQALFFHIPGLLLLGTVFRGAKREDNFWRKAPARLGLAVLFYLASIPLIWFYSILYQLFLHQMGHSFYLQDVALLFLAPTALPEKVVLIFVAVVIAPLFEEFLFRGVLFPWVVRRIGLWPAVGVVSLFFASIHVHLPSLLPLFLLSSLFCLAYARTRSLLVPIGMHACFNGVTVILLSIMG